MENLEKTPQYRIVIKKILSQYATYKPSYGEIDIQTLFDTEHDHYQVLGVGWKKKKEFRLVQCT